MEHGTIENTTLQIAEQVQSRYELIRKIAECNQAKRDIEASIKQQLIQTNDTDSLTCDWSQLQRAYNNK